MSAKHLAISLAFLAAFAAPGVFSQEVTAGNPEDISAVFPEETVLFAELVKPGRVYKEWKDYLAAFCTPEGKARVIEHLDKLSKQLDGEPLPEKLVKDMEKGFPTIQRVAVGLGQPHGGEDPFWAVVASASGEGFFKDLIDDLRVFSAEEVAHGGSKILVIRKAGKHDLPFSMCVAAHGRRLIVSSSVGSVQAVIDRAEGKAKGGDLRKNPAYARFAPPTGDDPYIRAFGEMNWFGLADMFGGGGRSFGYRRATAHGMDMADAVLGFRKIRGAVLEATLRPGKIAATTRVLIDSPCGLYDAWRQPAGPKDLLKLVPGDTQVAVHFNLRGGTELVAEIDKLVQRYAELERRGTARRVRVAAPEDFNWKKGFEREMGLSIDEAAAAIGNELAFAMVGDDALGGEQNMVGSLLFLVAATDAAKAKAIIEKLLAKMGPYEAKKEGDATVWAPGQEGNMPVVALSGKTVLVGMKVETIKKALKTAADGTGFGKQLPAAAAGASKLFSLRYNAIWSMLKMTLGAQLPDLSKDLDLNAISTVLFTEEKNEMRISSLDGGLGLEMQAGVMMVPLIFFAGRSIGRVFNGNFEDPDLLPGKKEPVKESPPLPADQLAAQVAKHLAGMRADDVVTREDSESALKALGAQAAKLLADAVRKETDAEVKGRIMGILSAWKAYDAYPELLKTKVDGFLVAFQKATAQEGNNRGSTWIRWREDGMTDFPYGMEPMYWDTGLLQRVEHHDVLEAPQGMRALAERLTEGKMNVQTLRNVCAVFAFNECGSAGDLLLAARAKVEDAESKNFLQIALGWSSDPKARSAVYAGFKDADVWMRRASFLAIEHTKDPAAVPALIDLLTTEDAETQWNASFTLREVTRGGAMVNVFVADAELKSSIAAAREWWEKNKATFKFGE